MASQTKTDEPQVAETLQVLSINPATTKLATNALNTAKSYHIDSPEMRDFAAADLGKIKALLKSVEEERFEITRPLDQAKKRVMALFATPTKYLEQAEVILKGAIQTYDRAEQQKRIAEQARLEEAARKERARLAAEAAEREAAAREEAEKIRRAAEEAAAAGRAQEAARLAEEARSREEEGAAEVATLQQTSQLITSPMAAAPQKSAGVSTRRVWKAEVNDKLALIRYVAAHPEYIDLLEPSMPAINKIALALKANCPLEGVRVFEDTTLAVRAA